MGLETATSIGALNALWPLGSDPRSQGDDHLRLIKSVLQADALSKAVGGEVSGPITVRANGLAYYLQRKDDATVKVSLGISPTGELVVQNAGTGGNQCKLVIVNDTVNGGLQLQRGANVAWLRPNGSSAGDGLIMESPVQLYGDPGSKLAEFQVRVVGGDTLFYGRNNAGSGLVVGNRTAGQAWSSISSAAGWVPGSDARLKEDVEPLGYGLETLRALRPVSFAWKDGGRRDIGFIAQEVQEVVPELVEHDEGEDWWGLRKDGLTAILTAVVVELAARLDALEASADGASA